MKKYFEGTNFIKYLIMESQSDKNMVKHIAKTLLNVQVSKWKTDNLSDEAVYIELQLNEPNSNPLKNNVFPNWTHFLRLKYKRKVSNNMMFNTMAKYYKGDRFIKYLVEEAKTGTTRAKSLAYTLLGFEIKKGYSKKLSEETLFELLQLNEPNSNPLTNPLFSVWFTFSKAKHPKAYPKKMFDILSKNCGDDSLIKYLDVEAKTGIMNMNKLAKRLLDSQTTKMVKGERDEAIVFGLLHLNKPDSNPLESPFFCEWANLVEQQYADSDNACKVMLDRLERISRARMHWWLR